MTKVDIIENIYEKVGFSKKEVAKIVESVFDIMKENLRQETKIRFRDSGTSWFGERGQDGAATRKPARISRSVREGF